MNGGFPGPTTRGTKTISVIMECNARLACVQIFQVAWHPAHVVHGETGHDSPFSLAIHPCESLRRFIHVVSLFWSSHRKEGGTGRTAAEIFPGATYKLSFKEGSESDSPGVRAVVNGQHRETLSREAYPAEHGKLVSTTSYS